MKPSQTKKRAMSAETFNMLMFAVILILAILVTVAIHAIVGFTQEDKEGNGQANTNQAGQQKTVTYHLNNPYTGVLSLCSPSSPWTEAQVDSVASTLIPLKPFASYEKPPYLLAKDTLRAQAEAVMALGDLCQALLDTGITAIPVVTEAYLPYSEAKEGAGTSPFHTGYALTLSLRVTLTGAEETLPLTNQHPLVASATLWLCGHAHTFGFVAPDPNAPGTLLYVSPPHATAMRNLGLTPTAYLPFVSSYSLASPLIVGEAPMWRIFHLPATHGVATLTLPHTTAYYVTGDGGGGFVVTIPA